MQSIFIASRQKISGDWLGCYRVDSSVGILHNMGSGNWLVLIWRLMGTIALGLGQFQRFLSCDLGAAFHKLPLNIKTSKRAFPGGCGKESARQGRKRGFNPWSAKTPRPMGQLSSCTTTIEPVLWSPEAATTEVHTPWSPCSTGREATATRSLCIATKE